MKSFAINSWKVALIATVLAFASIGVSYVYAAATGVTINPGQSYTVTCVNTTPTPTPPPAPSPTPTPPPAPAPQPTSGEVTKQIYNTFFGWPDNTPNNSSELSTGGSAGGTGTYNDPITAASGWIQSGGKEILDFPYGTKFYVPSEKKYFSIQDQCGDPPSPQSKACHTITDSAGKGAAAQIDLWAGGVGSRKGTSAGNAVERCEEAHTRINTVIFNPSPNYPVVPGQVCN